MTKYAKLIDGRPEWAPRVIRTDGYTISNPSGERLAALGYKPVIYDQKLQTDDPSVAYRPVYQEQQNTILVHWDRYTPASEPLPAYEQQVEALIRQQYSVSDELAILRQRDTKPEEFKAYFEYCEQCKAEAKREIVQ